MAEKSGPEKFATPDRRSPEKLIDVDQAAANAFEGETREFVRRDVSVLHRQRSEVDAANDPAADSLNTLVRRIAGPDCRNHPVKANGVGDSNSHICRLAAGIRDRLGNHIRRDRDEHTLCGQL